jgi:hypothetical protein
MPGFESREHGCYILSPRESIVAAITNQTLRGRAQVHNLAGFYFRLAGLNLIRNINPDNILAY